MSQGYSARVAERICEPQSQSTRDLYQGKWRIFVSYCEDKGIDPWQASLPQISEFLSYLFDVKKMMPTTVDGYRTAIAGALKHSRGYNMGKDPELSDLSSWMHRNRPRSSRVTPPWDLKLILLALQESPFEPIQDPEKVTLQHLTWKAAFLTLLASAGRRGEVHALDYASVQHDPKWKFIILKPHSEFVSKTQLRTHGASKLEAFKIPSLLDFVGPDLQRDKKLCPVRTLKTYLARTKNMREGKRLLFISHRPEHKSDIHRNTLSGWIRKLLSYVYQHASEDTITLAGTSAHAIRGLAATLAYKGGTDVEELIRSCHWSNQTTFTEYYLKDISVIENGANKLGPIVAAQQVVHRY